MPYMTALLHPRRRTFAGRAHATLLVAAMALVLVASAQILAGTPGVVIAAGSLAAGLWWLPRASPTALLRLFRAVRVGPQHLAEVHAELASLAGRAGLPRTPSLWVIHAPGVTAFSVGAPEDSGVGVSHRVLHKLSRREIAGILAHEVSHIAGGDMTLLALGQVIGQLTRAITTFGLGLSLLLLLAGQIALTPAEVFVLALAPMGVTLIQLALSRNREFDADQAAVLLTGDPVGLASALVRIEQDQRSLIGRMFGLARREVPELLRTHPRTVDRAARLLG